MYIYMYQNGSYLPRRVWHGNQNRQHELLNTSEIDDFERISW